jgi:hypothetical protein
MDHSLLTSSVAVGVALALFASSPLASADTISGRLTTGISGSNGTTVDGVVVTAPVATPAAGVYSSTQHVTLSAAGSSSIRFTTNGTAPTCALGTVYSDAITVSTSQVIEAISCYSGGVSSTVAAYQYAINPPSGGGGGGGGGGATLSAGGGGSLSLFSKGDSNKDGHINITDFVALMANWGRTNSGNVADFNSDGKVDILDFVILMANWTN